jgi:hypothetical protein
MNRKAPLPRIVGRPPTWHRAAALAREWQLDQLADRVEAMEQAAKEARR